VNCNLESLKIFWWTLPYAKLNLFRIFDTCQNQSVIQSTYNLFPSLYQVNILLYRFSCKFLSTKSCLTSNLSESIQHYASVANIWSFRSGCLFIPLDWILTLMKPALSSFRNMALILRLYRLLIPFPQRFLENYWSIIITDLLKLSSLQSK
jgi:hypothetical protein